MFRRFLRPLRGLIVLAGVLAAVPLFSLQDPSLLGNPVPPAQCRASAPPWQGLQVSAPAVAAGPELRVLIFNLHSGLGPGHARNRSAEQVQATLRGIAAAIVHRAGPVDALGLNEVDFRAARSGWVDQPAFLAAELQRLTGYTYTVLGAPTWRRDAPGRDVEFGNALLVRHPVLATSNCLFGSAECGGADDGAGVRSGDTPGDVLQAGGTWLGRLLAEPRGVLRATLQVEGRQVDVLVTHLEAFATARREEQAAALVRMLARPGRPTVLLGDINAVPSDMTGRRRFLAADRTHDVLSSGPLVDARLVAAARHANPDLAPWATYPASAPAWPLDAVFGSTELWPAEVLTVGGGHSDHLGLYVRYQWTGEEAGVGPLHARMQARQLARVQACDLVGPAEARLPRLQWMLEANPFWTRAMEELAAH